MKIHSLAALCAASFLPMIPGAHAHDANEEMAKAANTLLGALSAEQKSKAVFEFKDKERTDWHFVPKKRNGLPLKEMTEEQRKLTQELLKSALSHRGYEKAQGIIALENVLLELEKGRGPLRDPEMYFVSVFGKPGGAEPWGWRFEGHHLALNFTAVGDEPPVMTPNFFGSNPGEVKDGPKKGTRVLAAEEDLARELVKSLDEEQRKVAVILAEAPKEIFNVPGRADTKPEGLPYAKMNEEQKVQLVKLIREYLDRYRADVAKEDFAKLEKAGLDTLHFAWAGGLERGQPHYYRVQGGTFVLEYDNTQNNANHVHSIWRDFTREFGVDLLGKHYKESHGLK